MSYAIDEDGKTHINAYSGGRTELGRLLSNFAHTPFEHPSLGHFESIEGLWYFLGTPSETRDRLRYLHGFQAKKTGRELRSLAIRTDHFEALIELGLTAKLVAHPRLRELLMASGEIPIVHYYVFNGKVTMPKNTAWIWEEYMRLRTRLREIA